jgi:hypothetical protein
MSRGRVAICALIAMFIFGALAGPALAKRVYKREFTASGTAKLVSSSTSPKGQEFVFSFDEKGAIKFACSTAEGRGEVVPTEGVASSFIDKVKFAGCTHPGRKHVPEKFEITPVELEFNANGTISILNEVKVRGPLRCTIFLSPQTIGEEAVEEGKKGPASYTQEGTPPSSKVAVKIQTHTREAGEEGGFEFEQEEGHCGEFKTEGGKWKGMMSVLASSPKESWIGFHEEALIVHEE